MMSAAARSRREESLCSESILQRLQIEVAIVNANGRRSRWWNGQARARLTGARNGKHSCVPASFEITNFFGGIAVAFRVLEVRHVRGKIKQARIRNQRTTLRIYHRNGHGNRLYVS